MVSCPSDKLLEGPDFRYFTKDSTHSLNKCNIDLMSWLYPTHCARLSSPNFMVFGEVSGLGKISPAKVSWCDSALVCHPGHIPSRGEFSRALASAVEEEE